MILLLPAIATVVGMSPVSGPMPAAETSREISQQLKPLLGAGEIPDLDVPRPTHSYGKSTYSAPDAGQESYNSYFNTEQQRLERESSRRREQEEAQRQRQAEEQRRAEEYRRQQYEYYQRQREEDQWRRRNGY